MRIINDIKKYRNTKNKEKRTSSDGKGIKKGNMVNIYRKTALIKGKVSEMFIIKDKKELWIEYVIELPNGKYGVTERKDFHNIEKVGG